MTIYCDLTNEGNKQNYYNEVHKLVNWIKQEEDIIIPKELKNIKVVNWDDSHIQLQLYNKIPVRVNNPNTNKPLFEIKSNKKTPEIIRDLSYLVLGCPRIKNLK